MSLHSVIAVLFLSAVFGPMAYRLMTPWPAEDLKAIERFLKNRDEKLLKARKLWIGGPGSQGLGRYTQVGRPYRVIAQSHDGSMWTHDLAIDGWDPLGNPLLKQRISNVWSSVIQ